MDLVTALKALSQEGVILPMAEDDWATRPDTVSYGVVQMDFEVQALYGDDIKVGTAYEGSVDLFSKQRDGEGWVELITAALTEHCDGAWSLNLHAYERETGLFHWEWAFQIDG